MLSNYVIQGNWLRPSTNLIVLGFLFAEFQDSKCIVWNENVGLAKHFITYMEAKHYLQRMNSTKFIQNHKHKELGSIITVTEVDIKLNYKDKLYFCPQ